MQNPLLIHPVLHIPIVKSGNNIAEILIDALQKQDLKLEENDILCIASKIISVSENRFVSLDTVEPSSRAIDLHKKVQRKDPRVIELMLEQANFDEGNIKIENDWIGVKSGPGRVLTSAGIDRIDDNQIVLLPKDPDGSARTISKKIRSELNINVGILITDSDGRSDIAGATQICIGLYGVPPIREDFNAQETACDMLAAAAGLVMGQRGKNIPAVIIRGFRYEFNDHTSLKEAL